MAGSDITQKQKLGKQKAEITRAKADTLKLKQAKAETLKSLL
jgi:hypothetical protein